MYCLTQKFTILAAKAFVSVLISVKGKEVQSVTRNASLERPRLAVLPPDTLEKALGVGHPWCDRRPRFLFEINAGSDCFVAGYSGFWKEDGVVGLEMCRGLLLSYKVSITPE